MKLNTTSSIGVRRVRSGALILLCVAALLWPAGPAAATPAQRDALLARIEFNQAEKPRELGAALAKLEREDWAWLCAQLVPPGTGDDTRPRMALEALTWYLGSEGSLEQRTRFMHVLAGALRSEQPAVVKAFYVRALQLVGDPQAVPALAPLLVDPELFDGACAALLAIGGPEATEALRSAYPRAQGAPRVALIDALGQSRDRSVVRDLVADAGGPDAQVRYAALAALANLGEEKAFWEALRQLKLETPFEHAQADALVFRLGERLLEQGDIHAGANFAAGLTRPESHVRCAALALTTRAWGAEAAALLVKAMGEDDPELRAAAIQLAVRVPGKEATEQLLAQLPAASPTGCATLIGVLAQRGDYVAVPAVQAALQHADPAVRRMAVSALAVLAREGAIAPIVTWLEGRPQDEKDAAAATLRALPAPASVALAQAIETAGPDGQVVLLRVLGERRATDQAPAVYPYLSSTDRSIRLAALETVALLGDEQALPRLLPLLPALAEQPDDTERVALENALAASARRARGQRKAGPILAALPTAEGPARRSLVRVLGRVGGSDGFDALRRATTDPDPQLQEAAYRALLELPDAGLANQTLQLARSAKDDAHHVLAMRAYVRLVELEPRPPQATLSMYEAGLHLVRRPEERRLLIGKIGEVTHPMVLKVLEPLLSDREVQEEAAAALLNVAERLLPAGWEPARLAVRRASAAATSDALRQRAAEVQKRVSEYEGFVLQWQVAGPYMRDDVSGLDLVDVPFPPEERAAAGVAWQNQPGAADPAQFWVVDLNANRDLWGANRVAYLRTVLTSSGAQDVVLELGSDDALKVWLNGEPVHRYAGVRGCERGQDKVPVQLRPGRNELLLKVVNVGGSWAACLRVTGVDGAPVEGLRVELPPVAGER